VKDNSIVVAEFWKVKKTNRTLLLLDEQGTTAYLDELKGAKLVTRGWQEFIEADGKRIPIAQFPQMRRARTDAVHCERRGSA
jgi:hypothetical protein